MVWLSLASFLLLMATSRSRGTPAGLSLAFFIAPGIGLNNFGGGARNRSGLCRGLCRPGDGPGSGLRGS